MTVRCLIAVFAFVVYIVGRKFYIVTVSLRFVNFHIFAARGVIANALIIGNVKFNCRRQGYFFKIKVAIVVQSHFVGISYRIILMTERNVIVFTCSVFAVRKRYYRARRAA